MDGSAAPDVTLERLHEIADAFARRDVDGIVNSFAEDGEFRNARGIALLGPSSFKGKVARSCASLLRTAGPSTAAEPGAPCRPNRQVVT